MKKIMILALTALLLLTVGCSAQADKNGGTKKVANRIAVFETNLGTFEIELFEDKAPKTTKNFIDLTEKGFYDGVIFHRVIDGFMIQGGDPTGTGMGGPGYAIKGEFASNGFENNLSHQRGVISMARAQHPDSAGSQFFIMHADYPALDGQYAAFGRVIEGIEAVDHVAATPTDANDRPVEDQAIKTIRVETNGVIYTAEKIQ